MTRYFIRRVFLGIPTVLIVTFIVFALVRLMPGDPASTRLGEAWSVGAAERITEQLGLDRPWYEQYLSWLAGAVRGDLGDAMIGGGPVAAGIASRLGATATLTVFALVVAVTFGLSIGLVSAIKRDTFLDHGLRAVAIAGISIPNFFIAVLLIGYRPLGWSPPLGEYEPLWVNPGQNLALLGPAALILGITGGAPLMRIARTSMLEVLGHDYLRTARAKGLSNRRVILGHAMRNALLPSITVIGLIVVALISGTVIFESIFGIPGVGFYLLQSASMRDYNAIQGIAAFITVVVVFANIIVDMTYAVVDPRLRGSL